MANHVYNALTINGTEEQVNEVKEFIKDDNEGLGSIDFNKITPMPKWIYQGSLSSVEEEKYGKENCWSEWSFKNWGTNRNAYRFDTIQNLSNVIVFVTAWASPVISIHRLSWIFPSVEFEISWSDPYSTQGEFVFKDGVTIHSEVTETELIEIEQDEVIELESDVITNKSTESNQSNADYDCDLPF